jgi:hypothetical protein
VKKQVLGNQRWIAALMAIIGAAFSGCFPADEGAQTSMSIPLTDLGVSSAAVTHWVDWYNQNQETKQADFDLGIVGSDFFFGLQVENAETLTGQSVTYDETQNTIIANVWVLGCKQCVFQVTIFTVTDNVTAQPLRVVKTFWGKSSEVTIETQEITQVDMSVKLLDVGQIICRSTGAALDEYELSAVDAMTGVRFPSGTSIVGNAAFSVLLSNIPKGRKMEIEIRKNALAAFESAKYQGNNINVMIPDPSDVVEDCVFDPPQ